MLEKSKLQQFILTQPSFEGRPVGPYNFPFPVEKLAVDSYQVNETLLEATYDRHGNLYLTFETDEGVRQVLSENVEFTISDPAIPKELKWLIINSTFNSAAGTQITVTPVRSPVLLDFGGAATRIEAIVLNAPQIFARDRKIEFEMDDFKLEMHEFAHASNCFKQYRSMKYESVATSHLSLSRRDSAIISHEMAFRKVGFFSRFLTLIRGQYSAAGNIIGYGESGEIAFSYLGFTRFDHFKAEIGWFVPHFTAELPELFSLYCKAIKHEGNKTPLLRAIEFYRASNAGRRSSLETALIVSFAALETIVPHTLSKQAGWSQTLLSEKNPFHDKLRAACAFIELQSDPLLHLSKLVKLARNQNEIDAFELLSKFRNRIVHPGKPFKYTGQELYEAWQLSQWLCEIFLFHWFGYRGKMSDRRRLTGWLGDGERVPLP